MAQIKQKNSFNLIILLIAVALVVMGVFYFFRQPAIAPDDVDNSNGADVDNANGADGQAIDLDSSFKYKDLVKLEQPLPETTIASPLVIEGEARGTWYFEADFPVVLTDWDGKIIAQGVATAQADWMTEEFVPFSAELEFTKPDYGQTGNLILQKDNPSGLPEYDDALEIKVYFE